MIEKEIARNNRQSTAEKDKRGERTDRSRDRRIEFVASERADQARRT